MSEQDELLGELQRANMRVVALQARVRELEEALKECANALDILAFRGDIEPGADALSTRGIIDRARKALGK